MLNFQPCVSAWRCSRTARLSTRITSQGISILGIQLFRRAGWCSGDGWVSRCGSHEWHVIHRPRPRSCPFIRFLWRPSHPWGCARRALPCRRCPCLMFILNVITFITDDVVADSFLLLLVDDCFVLLAVVLHFVLDLWIFFITILSYHSF